MIDKLAEKVWSNRPVGTTWFDYKEYARLIIEECTNICAGLAENYEDSRFLTDDFTYKNQLAEGEAACNSVARDIKKRFFK